MISLVKKITFILTLVSSGNVLGQTLSISSNGETGTSGTNWSVSGSNPVIITATGTANVNTSVIEGYLNAGTSVMLVGSLISVDNAIDKTAGGDATLTLRAGGTNTQGYGRAMINAGVQSTSGALNIVLWSDYNNHNRAGATVGGSPTINTNGGHFWMGGSATAQGATTWNGLTVGNGPSVNAVGLTNQNAVDINGVALNTSGGDVFVWAAPGAGGGIQGISFNSSSITTGAGDIVLATDVIAGAATLTSTGHLYLVPDGGAYAGAVTWSHNNASPNIDVTGTFNALTINAFNSLGGFTIGNYEGMTGVTFSNTSSITVTNSIDVAGPVSVYGNSISANANITTQGDLYMKAINAIDFNVNAAVTTNGGDVVYWSTATDGNGYIRPATITTNGGHVYMGGNALISGTRTWHGHTVGAGYAYSLSFDGVALRGNIDTRVSSNPSIGGDVLIAGESGNSNGADVGAEIASRTISTGDGDIILMPFSEQLQQIGGSFRMNLETTGKVAIAPVSGNSFWGFQTPQLTYNGSFSSGTFTGSSALAGVQIPNIATIGGLELGTYSGTGVVGDSPYVDANVKNMRLDAGFSIAGPISVHGNALLIQQALECTTAGAKIKLTSNGSGSGLTNGFMGVYANLTTNGGDLILWANKANITGGTQANNEITFGDNVQLNSSGGEIVLAGGLDDGANGGTASDGIPDGYAYRGGYTGGAINLPVNIAINSSGGDIIIRGQQHNISGTGSYAVIFKNDLVINSGTGTIEIDAVNNGNHAIHFADGQFAITSASTEPTAINISATTTGTSETSSAGFVFNFNNGADDALIQSTGASGGDIVLTATNGGGGKAFWMGENDATTSLQILSNAGDISLITNGDIDLKNNFQLYLGNRRDAIAIEGITPVPTAAAGDITIRTRHLNLSSAGDDLFVGSTGNFVLEPFATSFSEALGLDAKFSFSSTLSSLRIGKEGNTANITTATAQTIAGPISVYGGDITVNQNLTSTASEADILLKGSGYIAMASGSSNSAYRTLQTNNGNIVLWANSADGTSGGIQIGDWTTFNTANGSTTQTNGGGKVWLAGGSGVNAQGLPTGAANGGTARSGISFGSYSPAATTTSIYSGGGDIYLNGESNAINPGWGVAWNRTGIANAGDGTLTIKGEAKNASGYHGIELGAFDGSINITAGGGDASTPAILINGITARSDIYRGLQTISGPGTRSIMQATGTGGITILAKGVSNGTAASYASTLDVLAASGDILISAEGGTGLDQVGTIGQKTGTDVTSSSSNVTLRANSITVPAGTEIQTTGTLVVEPFGTSFTNALTWPLSNLTLGSGITGLRLGKNGNTANLTINSAQTIAGPISVYGGNIALNAATTATGSDINLYASGAVSQSAALTANRLALNGTGSFTLQNSANNVGIIAGGDNTTRLGNLAYRDADALEIGSVNPDGIFSSGTILVETENGDLTLSQNINTTSTSDDAIIVNAGRAAAAGTATGGNVLVSGSPTLSYGTGGRAKLFSGIDGSSTGLTTLVGGAANTRAGFDEASDLSGEGLVDDNAYAIYRVSSGTGDLTIVASGGDAENSTWSFDSGSRTLSTISNPVNVNASVVEGYLASGDLTIEAANITINAAVSHATDNDWFLAAQSNIFQTTIGNITTQGGAVVLRSNSNDTSNGRVDLFADFTTNGGALYIGGGSASETIGGLSVPTGNSITNENNRNGIYIKSLSINTGGGNLRMRGQNASVDGSNTGLIVIDSDIQTGAGELNLFGRRTENPNMSGGLWLGTAIGSVTQTGNVTLSTTSGDINLEGISEATNSFVWSHGLMLMASGTEQISLSTGSGNISIIGNATNAALQSGEAVGLVAQMNNNTAGLSITTDGGSISFEGISGNTGATSGLALRANNTAGSITIGDANTGDITFRTGSLQTTDRIAGSIVVESAGNVVFEGPTGGNFATDINISDEYDFKSAIASLRLGKTNNTTTRISLYAPVNISGPMSIYADLADIYNNINTSTANGDIFIQGATRIEARNANRNFNSGSGNITLSTNLLSNTNSQAVVESTGTFTLQPFGTAFSSYGNVLDFSGSLSSDTFTGVSDAAGLRINNVSQLGGLVFGKEGNTTGFSTYHDWAVNGSIKFIGGDITVAGNLTASANAAEILLKSVGNITQAANKNISTNNGDVIFWADSDADGGFITINAGASMSTQGGDLVLAGGLDDGSNVGVASDGIPDGFAWRKTADNDFGGLSLGEGGIASPALISLNSGGGNIILRGTTSDASDHPGVLTQEALVINAGSGTIDINGTSSTGHGIEMGFGTSTLELAIRSASNLATAITIQGATTAAGKGGFFNLSSGSSLIQSEGTGAITISGTSTLHEGVVLDHLQILSASGKISLTGTGPNHGQLLRNTDIGLRSSATTVQGITPLAASSADIDLIANTLSFGTSANTMASTGTLRILPSDDAFSSALTLESLFDPSVNLTGLEIGKDHATAANITLDKAISIAGPIAAYGGTITLGADVTTTNNGDISLYTDNPLGGLNTSRTLTASGAFKYIPLTTTFSADVTYPITNLTATSTGLTIGNATNDKNITINADVTGDAGIELFGTNININANLKTTNSGTMVLKGNSTIAAGKYIESNGNFTHDGNLLFKSDANGTAAFGTLGGSFTTTSGTVQVERYIPAKRAFRFLSPSVTTTTSIRNNWQENGGTAAGLGTHITGTGGSANGFDATGTDNPSMFTFSNGSWVPVTSTLGVLTAGTPYRLMVRGDRTTDLTSNTPTPSVTTLRATGALHTGDFTPVLNQTAEGFSFIGNPYQAPMDMKAVLTNSATNMNTSVLYYWDPTLNTRGGYVTRTLSGTAVNNITSSFTEVLQPGQAVFVKKDNTSTVPSLTISETHKVVSQGAAGAFRNAVQNNSVGLIRANLQANWNNQWQTTDAALAVFNDTYSWNVTEEDAVKIGNLDEEVSFVKANTALAITQQSSAALTDELPIRLNQLRHTNYRWYFDLTHYNGYDPYLVDIESNTITAIDDATVIPFTVGADATNRFKIVFQNNTLSTPDVENPIVVYPNPSTGGELYIKGVTGDVSVAIHNLLGQNIPATLNSRNGLVEVTTNTTLSKGVYLVSVTSEGITQQVKWMVK